MGKYYLERLYNGSKHELNAIILEMLKSHSELMYHVINGLFTEDQGNQLLSEIKAYDRFSKMGGPIAAIAINDTIQLNGESDEDFANRTNAFKHFSSPTSILTLLMRLSCRNLGKISPVEHFSQNMDDVIGCIKAAMAKHNSSFQHEKPLNPESDFDMLHYIYQFYYVQSALPHTFPIYRCIIAFIDILRSELNKKTIIELIRAKAISAKALARLLMINDTSAGWGDRGYATILLRQAIVRKLVELEYSEDYVAEFRSQLCYMGFDVNKAMDPIYKQLFGLVCDFADLPHEIAIVHIADSTSAIALRHMLANSYGNFLTSSPTPLELYSDEVEDSSNSYCTSGDPQSDALNWNCGFVLPLLSNIMRTFLARQNAGLPPMRLYEFMDSYSVSSPNHIYIPVAERFIETLELAKLPNYSVSVQKICYADEEHRSIKGCRKCSQKQLCDRCVNTYTLRSMIILRQV